MIFEPEQPFWQYWQYTPEELYYSVTLVIFVPLFIYAPAILTSYESSFLLRVNIALCFFTMIGFLVLLVQVHLVSENGFLAGFIALSFFGWFFAWILVIGSHFFPDTTE
jgi:hypothetical protein